MAFVAAANVVSLEAIFHQDNQPVENTFHYHLGSAPSSTTLSTMATAFFTWANANKALWPTNVELIKLYLRDLSAQSSFADTFTPATPIVGTKADTPLPNNCTVAIKRETGLAGRANRGRVFWIGICEGDKSDANHITAGRMNTFVTGLNSLMTAMAGTPAATEVLLHRATGSTKTILGYTYSDLTIDNMRRRLPDHNRHH